MSNHVVPDAVQAIALPDKYMWVMFDGDPAVSCKDKEKRAPLGWVNYSNAHSRNRSICTLRQEHVRCPGASLVELCKVLAAHVWMGL